MRLWFEGHDYKYAVEQMLSTLFPGERPNYQTGKPEGDGMTVRLNRADHMTTATCVWISDGKRYFGRAAFAVAALNPEDNERLRQYAVKNAVYRAVLDSGMSRPHWGALTGVRPGKLMHGIITSGAREKEEAVARFCSQFDVSRERAELCYETGMRTDAAMKSLSPENICLYVGIPFCPTRCAYCSFVSQSVEKNMKLIGPFVDALEKEIRETARRVKECGLVPVSVYMGGGTPTTLSATQLERVLGLLESEFDLSKIREFTVEAGRPDTITTERLEVLRRFGVDRISVNPQTMNDSVLEAIGRRHSAQDIISALEKVRRVGGFAVNMDVIAGLPTDSVEGFERTMKSVLELEPENITVHTLSMKRGSTLMTGRAEVPSALEVGRMLEGAYGALREKKYLPYYLYRQKNMSGGFENTGWTLSGHVNLYNICIMEELCGIISMGGGGSTKLIGPAGGRNERFCAPKYPLEYIEQIERTCAAKAKIGDFYGIRSD